MLTENLVARLTIRISRSDQEHFIRPSTVRGYAILTCPLGKLFKHLYPWQARISFRPSKLPNFLYQLASSLAFSFTLSLPFTSLHYTLTSSPLHYTLTSTPFPMNFVLIFCPRPLCFISRQLGLAVTKAGQPITNNARCTAMLTAGISTSSQTHSYSSLILTSHI